MSFEPEHALTRMKALDATKHWRFEEWIEASRAGAPQEEIFQLIERGPEGNTAEEQEERTHLILQAAASGFWLRNGNEGWQVFPMTEEELKRQKTYQRLLRTFLKMVERDSKKQQKRASSA